MVSKQWTARREKLGVRRLTVFDRKTSYVIKKKATRVILVFPRREASSDYMTGVPRICTGERKSLHMQEHTPPRRCTYTSPVRAVCMYIRTKPDHHNTNEVSRHLHPVQLLPCPFLSLPVSLPLFLFSLS